NWPIGDGVERYEHRHDWRTGANGHTELSNPGSAPTEDVLAAELRFVMGGATSTASAGSRPGLLLNVDSADNEGLPLQAVDSDTCPRDDGSGIQRADDANDGNGPTSEGFVAGLAAYLPHIGEGIDQYAHNELYCTATAPGVIEANTAIVHATGAILDDA